MRTVVRKISLLKKKRGSIQPQGEDDPRSLGDLGDHVASPGLKFTDLVVPSDVQRVSQILDTKSEHGSADAMAHVFRTHLMDSYDSKFCAEVFQVKFTLASGAKCHIVGLRRREEIGSKCVVLGNSPWLGNLQTQWRFIAGTIIELNGWFCHG